MATTPAITDDATAGGKSRGAGLLEGFYSLNLMRQLGLMVGIAASAAIGIALVLWVQGGDYKPLYASLEYVDSGKVMAVLDGNEIKYKLDEKSGALLVEADKIHQARLKLADAGMAGDRAAGFELLDKEQPLGSSQFMETTRYRRSLEGELARTVMSISSVRNARVHLAQPKSSVFIRDTRKPSASVLLELYPGTSLSKDQVRAIANLVASSVPDMQLADVTVVDQKGNLLSRFDDDNDMEEAEKQLAYSKKVEDRVMTRLDELLHPLLGDGKYRAQVSADVDFTAVEQADETYNPDLPAMRSEQTMEEARAAGTVDGGVPGALSNQPPAAGTAPEQANQQAAAAPGTAATPGAAPAAPPQDTRRSATRNYELDRTVSYTRHQVGRLKRITVAVAVDDLTIAGEDGKSTRKQWDQAELDRLTILIKDAVGFDAARGDSVNVINTAFMATQEVEIPFEETPLWQKLALEYARPVAGFIFAMVFLLTVVRPVFRNLSAAGGASGKGFDGEAALAGGGVGGGDMGDTTVTLSGGDTLLLPSPNESYEQQLNAVKGLIAEDPGRVAQVIKRWVAQGE
jgi:flagellar M-ring protein FliF